MNSLNSALDIIARITGLAFENQTPVSFNKLCNKKNLDGPVARLRVAKIKWVNKLKDYRDCFTHYTPVDYLVSADVVERQNEYYVRCKLPTNPNVRDNTQFRYSVSLDVLKYSSTLYRHISALDKSISKEIQGLYKIGMFPMRKSNLFNVGARSR